jgi:hypothetical protein
LSLHSIHLNINCFFGFYSTLTRIPFQRRIKKLIFNFSASADNTYPDFINKFAEDTFSNCGVALGKKKPECYSGQYLLDARFPVYNIETGKQEPSE